MQSNALVCNNPLLFQSLVFPKALPVLVLAPHPDDFDAIGVTLRFLWKNGNPLYVAVATAGASGVEDSFCSPPTLEAKTALREEEHSGPVAGSLDCLRIT